MSAIGRVAAISEALSTSRLRARGCRHEIIKLDRRTPPPPQAQGCPGKSRIGEPQLIGRELGFYLARMDWRRGVDFRDRFSHEQALANEFGEAEVRHPQGVQTPCQAQQ